MNNKDDSTGGRFAWPGMVAMYGAPSVPWDDGTKKYVPTPSTDKVKIDPNALKGWNLFPQNNGEKDVDPDIIHVSIRYRDGKMSIRFSRNGIFVMEQEMEGANIQTSFEIDLNE